MNPPSLEAAEPTPIEQEPSITEPKVEIPLEVTKLQQKLAEEPSITEPKVEIPPEVTKPQQKLTEDSKEEVKIEPPQLPDPEAVKPSLSTTEVCVCCCVVWVTLCSCDNYIRLVTLTTTLYEWLCTLPSGWSCT